MVFSPVSVSIFLHPHPQKSPPQPTAAVSVHGCSCTPVMQMVTLKSRRHWSRLRDPALFKEGAQQASSQISDYLTLGKEATLQQHSQTAGNWVKSCPPYTEQGKSQQDAGGVGWLFASKVRDLHRAGLRFNLPSRAEICPMDSYPAGWASPCAASNTHWQTGSKF